MKLRRLCFYRCVSVHRGGAWSQGGVSAPGCVPGPEGSAPGDGIAGCTEADPSRERRLLLRTVRILLEWILVNIWLAQNGVNLPKLICLIIHCWLVRVTLVVAFGFLPQNFGMWWGPANGTLPFYECRFCGGDTMRWKRHSNPTLCKRNWIFCTHRYLSDLVEFTLPNLFNSHCFIQNFNMFIQASKLKISLSRLVTDEC